MKILERLTRALANAGALFVIAMMLLTVVDVLAKNLFHRPLQGTFELVQLSLVFAVFLGMPEVFRRNSNIVVDVLDHLLQPAAVSVLRIIGAGVALAFLLLLEWAVIAPAMDTIAYPQYTQEAGVSLTLFWVPIIVGIAVAIICAAAVMIREIRILVPGSRS